MSKAWPIVRASARTDDSQTRIRLMLVLTDALNRGSAYTQGTMAKRVFASVKPELLVWARNAAGYSVETAALALKISPETLGGWEAGDGAPSIPQLRGLAGVYRRPLAVFYLQAVPRQFQVLTDFRMSAGAPRSYSPALTQEIEQASNRRELMLELAEDLDEPVSPFEFRLTTDDPEKAGQAIRDFLKVPVESIVRFGGDATGRLGLNTWRLAMERAGVLVFQSSRIASEEASGFALAYDKAPVAVINRKDIPQRRLFSLMHEFAHVGLRESGVSDLEPRPQTAGRDVELICNSIAAAALMPFDVLMATWKDASGSQGRVTDDVIAQVSRRFGVSRPALLLRLVNSRVLSWDFYFDAVARFRAEYEQQRATRPPMRDMKRNVPQESLSDLGRPFVGMVLDNYHQRNLTLADVAGYLGIRVKHVQTLERRLEG